MDKEYSIRDLAIVQAQQFGILIVTLTAIAEGHTTIGYVVGGVMYGAALAVRLIRRIYHVG